MEEKTLYDDLKRKTVETETHFVWGLKPISHEMKEWETNGLKIPPFALFKNFLRSSKACESSSRMNLLCQARHYMYN